MGLTELLNSGGAVLAHELLGGSDSNIDPLRGVAEVTALHMYTSICIFVCVSLFVCMYVELY